RWRFVLGARWTEKAPSAFPSKPHYACSTFFAPLRNSICCSLYQDRLEQSLRYHVLVHDHPKRLCNSLSVSVVGLKRSRSRGQVGKVHEPKNIGRRSSR